MQYGIGPVTYMLLEHGLVDEFRRWGYLPILGSSGPAEPHFLSCPPVRLASVLAGSAAS